MVVQRLIERINEQLGIRDSSVGELKNFAIRLEELQVRLMALEGERDAPYG